MSTPLLRAAWCCAAVLFCQLLFAQTGGAQQRVILVGDSTVASGSGWGDAFGERLLADVLFENRAIGGRSSKSYRDEGYWEKALAQKPTWVLIQFGHNDQPGKGPERETDAKTSFRDNLARFVSEAREAGAKPVLISSIPRRNFNKEGRIEADDLQPSWNESQKRFLPDLLNDYVVAARHVAAKEKVPFVDLNALSIEQLNQLGAENAVSFDPDFPGLTHPDKTHLSPSGGKATAALLIDAIREDIPDLAALLRSPVRLSELSSWIKTTKEGDGFALSENGEVASLVIAEEDFEVVQIAGRNLAEDLEKVTGGKAKLSKAFDARRGGQVVIGTLGDSSVVDLLLQESSLDVSELVGAWESFVVAVVGEGETRNLAIIGSDRRGTAFGVYDLCQAIGVSPWHWWADSAVPKHETLFVSENTRRFGPPSVKYRGIFINDEDWGLQPWAAHTFDPQLGDIGPRTYEKVLELLLRLKANTLWPAMHEVTKAFNLYPENKVIADRYAIVMASSHAEPMLRNNVTEWSEPKSHFNYETHPELVKKYWEARVQENGSFENVYTLGMRGIHDSGMTGGGSKEDKIALLEKIISDQRELLQEHVSPELETVAQVFTPYKEVLELYESGLDVPEDVTIVWPDDNHGYLRRFPNDEERQRKGGSGVYYHISYLGAPLAYLWLDTTPLALVWEEMQRSFALGSRDYWILNVGDIKPQERGMEFFLAMAWDVERWGRDAQSAFLEQWAKREFGGAVAGDVASLMNEYYRLNFQRRPEHLQWWMPYRRVQTSPLTEGELKERLGRMREMIAFCDSLESELPEEAKDAFFQLVAYPVKASAYANLQYFHLEQYHRLFHRDNPMARLHGGIGVLASRKLEALTVHYNRELAGGKWNRTMAVEPADSAWRSFRTTPWILPADGMVDLVTDFEAAYHSVRFYGAKNDSEAKALVSREAEDFDRRGGSSARWETVTELGWSGDAIAVFPSDAKSIQLSDIDDETAWVEYDIELPEKGGYRLFLELLPSFPSQNSEHLQFAFGIDGAAAMPVAIHRKSKSMEWSKNVLEGSVGVEARFEVESPGIHKLRIYMMDTGVVLDRLFIHQGELAPSFSGPSVLR